MGECYRTNLDSYLSKLLITKLNRVHLFKAKAAAEAKALQAQGMKAGEDFVGCKRAQSLQCHLVIGCGHPFASRRNTDRPVCPLAQLRGNQQAQDVKEGLGMVGGLKKQL